MNRVDRKKVKRAFHDHADVYELHAMVQKEIIHRQMNLLQKEKIQPAMVLDIGCGTGILLREMRALFPGAALVGVDLALGMTFAARENLRSAELLNADAEKLPLRSGSFDLVVSTSTFQWLQGLHTAFSEVHRVLASGGFFFFSLFGEKTLHELRSSYQEACRNVRKGNQDRTHAFSGKEEVASALELSGFAKARLFSELIVETHPDVPDLLRSLKRIGAGNASPGEGSNPVSRQVMMEMMEIYRREYGITGKVPATYDVIYGIAEKKDT